MYKTRLLVLGALMACISALFQLAPAFLSEAFIMLTIFSAIPIYLVSRMNPKIGIITGIITFILIGFFSMHEALFFIFTNGTVGVSLGCFTHFTSKKAVFLPLSALVSTAALSMLNYVIGIPIFGVPIPGTFIVQILILLAFALVYCLIFTLFCEYVYRKLGRFISWSR